MGRRASRWIAASLTAASSALLVCACSARPPAPAATPAPEPADDLPAIAPADTPWPPASYDARHWVGADRSTFRIFFPHVGDPVSMVGCPFAPAPVPPCPAGIRAEDEAEIFRRRTELRNRVVTFAGGLEETEAFEIFFSQGGRGGTGTSALVVGRGKTAIWLDRSDDWSDMFDHPRPPHPFRCMGGAFSCCGITRVPRVVVRGHLALLDYGDGLWYVDSPLVCSVHETTSLIQHDKENR